MSRWKKWVTFVCWCLRRDRIFYRIIRCLAGTSGNFAFCLNNDVTKTFYLHSLALSKIDRLFAVKTRKTPSAQRGSDTNRASMSSWEAVRKAKANCYKQKHFAWSKSKQYEQKQAICFSFFPSEILGSSVQRKVRICNLLGITKYKQQNDIGNYSLEYWYE